MKTLWFALFSMWVASGAQTQAADSQQSLLVFGAASLTNALEEVGTAYTQSTGQPVKFSFGSSSALARQMEAGAKPDVFFSADLEWMDYVANRNLIRPKTRANLLTNRLVLIAPVDSSVQLEIAPNFELVAALGGGRLSMGDPDSVPAGKYARSALMSLGVWNQVADHLVRADNVRAALVFVGRGEAPLGIVYETDARVDQNVKVLGTFPEDSHPLIVYPAAVTVAAKDGAERFLEFARGAVGRAVFEKFGFGIAQ